MLQALHIFHLVLTSALSGYYMVLLMSFISLDRGYPWGQGWILVIFLSLGFVQCLAGEKVPNNYLWSTDKLRIQG